MWVRGHRVRATHGGSVRAVIGVSPGICPGPIYSPFMPRCVDRGRTGRRRTGLVKPRNPTNDPTPSAPTERTGPDPEGAPHATPTLVCPRCRGALHMADAESSCALCHWTGPVIDGVAVLAPELAQTEHDELDHQDGQSHKSAQAAYFDRVAEQEFEIDRPHATPRLYRFLLREKFRRGMEPLRPHLVGATALTVCGGSGMDAEYLARAGAKVISSDLSLGAASRTQTRAERYGLNIQSIVADVEHLPCTDRSVDLVAVHDGLHHLDDPYAGLSEMARVARRWVVVSEPARASITRLAARVGLALEREEAGNRVARVEPSEVAAFLRSRGYRILRAQRYAMYYRHRPGALSTLLSLPVVYPLVRVGWHGVNAVFGRFGNKMVVVAERESSV